MQADLLPWLVLYNVPGLGPATFCDLLEHFQTPSNIISQSPNALRKVAGIGPKTIDAITKNQNWEWARDQIARAHDANIHIHTLSDRNYPHILKQVYAPPPLLFTLGNIDLCNRPTIGVVGSRSVTAYGKETAYRLSNDLARSGVTIVSGMALGIDTHAHRGALESGATAAVLGSSLDCPYPPENHTLFQQIAKQGVVLSEFPLGTTPEAHNFPRRNRIISGLSLGTVVVEASARSGALITAQFALEQNRDVFAVPGPIHSGKSLGTNSLLRQGAILVQSAQDILNEISHLPQATPPQSAPPSLTSEEQPVWDALSDVAIHIDHLAQKTSLSVGETLNILLALEIQSKVEQLPGMRFRRRA